MPLRRTVCAPQQGNRNKRASLASSITRFDIDFQFLKKEPKVSPHGLRYEDGTAATAAQMVFFRRFMKEKGDLSSLSETAHLGSVSFSILYFSQEAAKSSIV